jgi:hypothetical protein
MDNKNYLPSKQFTVRVVTLVIIVLVVFGIYKLVGYIKNKPDKVKEPTKIAVKEIVQKDSNKNGIPDWEESLWGLDPAKDGPSNKEFILAQRAILAEKGIDSSVEGGTGVSEENETLSREFFAIIMALQQSGNLDEASLKAISDTIGENISASPIPDVYTRSGLSIKADSEAANEVYFEGIKNVLLKYQDKDIGNELTFISQGIDRSDPQAIAIAGNIAEAYKAFGKDLMKIAVPTTFATVHLSLANNYEKTGRSIEGMLTVLTNQIAGMKALVNYNIYSDALVSDMEELSSNYY